jgi:hypothetical protein
VVAEREADRGLLRRREVTRFHLHETSGEIPVTRLTASAASEPVLFFISSLPMLSEIMGALRRSASSAEAVESAAAASTVIEPMKTPESEAGAAVSALSATTVSAPRSAPRPVTTSPGVSPAALSSDSAASARSSACSGASGSGSASSAGRSTTAKSALPPSVTTTSVTRCGSKPSRLTTTEYVPAGAAPRKSPPTPALKLMSVPSTVRVAPRTGSPVKPLMTTPVIVPSAKAATGARMKLAQSRAKGPRVLIFMFVSSLLPSVNRGDCTGPTRCSRSLQRHGVK